MWSSDVSFAALYLQASALDVDIRHWPKGDETELGERGVISAPLYTKRQLVECNSGHSRNGNRARARSCSTADTDRSADQCSS
eukprot:6182890-Pleurochrysis_carterae.AAC.10